jgi:hypothetical protein
MYSTPSRVRTITTRGQYRGYILEGTAELHQKSMFSIYRRDYSVTVAASGVAVVLVVS